MEPFSSHTLKTIPFISYFLNENTILIFSKNAEFQLFDTNSGDRIQKITFENIDTSYKSSFFMTKDRQLFVMPSTNNGFLFYSFKEQKIIHELKNLEDKPSACIMDSKKRYFCCGFESGRCDIFLFKGLEYFDKTPALTDSVIYCDFFCNEKYFTTIGMDGKITINNFDTHEEPMRAKLVENKITSCTKIDDRTVLIVTSPSNLIFFDVQRKKIIKKMQVAFLKTLIPSKPTTDMKYLFFVKDSRKVGVIDLEHYTLISDSLIELTSDIVSLNRYKSDFIAVTTNSGLLNIYKLFDKEQLNFAIEDENYEKAYEITRKNPMLLDTKEYEDLETIWKNIFESAFKFFCQKRFEEGMTALEPFAAIAEKKGIIKKLEKEFGQYDELLKYISDKNYVRVYELVQNKEFLSKTPAFLKLEKQWSNAYKAAQDYIIRLADKARASALLEDFYNVPQKRQLIHNLLRNPMIFIDLKSAIANRDFPTVFSLVTRNKFLKDAPEYKNVLEYGQKLYEVIKRKLKNRIFTDIMHDIETLELFPGLEEELKELKMFSKTATAFLAEYDKHNYETCFEMIDRYPILNGFSEAKSLELEWRKDLNLAQNHALKGDINAIVRDLYKYFNIDTKHSAIGFIIKKAYLSQLKISAIKEEKEQAGWDYAINKFITLFGYDDDLITIMNRLKSRNIEVITKSNRTKVASTHWYNLTKGNVPIDIFGQGGVNG